MADYSDDAPRQQRRSTVLPPFFAPRQRETTTPTRPVGVTKRRTSQLFTPPGVDRQSRPAFRATPIPPATPNASAVPATPEVPATPVTPSASIAIPVESLEIEPPVAHVAEPIIEESAGAPLDAEASEEPRLVDGLEIEATEWSPEGVTGSGQLEVESFWAAEPLAPSDEVTVDAPSEAIEASGANAVEALPPWPSVDEAEHAGESAPDDPASAATWGGWPASQWEAEGDRDDAAHASEAVAPEVESSSAVPMSAGDELSAGLAWPDPDQIEAGGEQDVIVADGAALASVEPELRDSAAPFATPSPRHEETREADPWTMPPAEPSPEPAVPAVAEALERIAQRIREGGVVLPADTAAQSDAGALAVALAALLRGAPR
ncbi:MAG TPA: hypothetical protein VFS44_15780 [Gemmatimonadaceae bacterium]|nr:hypothetical protein [Gemmatimonadaceae bacterium]